MIDIHCHLLPGIDDGPPDLSATLALANSLVDDGITEVVMTPHVFPGRFENRRTSIRDNCAGVVQALHLHCPGLKVMWAGEVRLTPEVLDLLVLDELPFLGVSGGYRNMLLEMPDGQVPLGAEQFVRRLMKAGIRPVVAHPERNRMVMDHPERMQALVDEGCAIQLTAASVIGEFGPRAQATAQALMDAGWVQAVASDAHNLSGRRPRMQAAAHWLAKHYGAETAHNLTVKGPGSLCTHNLTANEGALERVAGQK